MADGLWKDQGFRVGTWNVDSLTGRAGELIQALKDREVDVACIQKTQWRGSGCKFFGAKSKRCSGWEVRRDGIGIFIAESEKWVDSVVCVDRHSERLLILKMVGQQEGHLACKKTEWWGAGVVICLGRSADLHMAIQPS